MIAVVIAILIVVVLVGGVLLVGRMRRRPEGVDSFRRQIDALSPDSRRPTMKQMKPSGRPADGEDGAHGT